MTETEPINYRNRYRLCRTGLLLAALANGLMAVDTAGHAAILLLMGRPPTDRIAGFLISPGWQWSAGTTIVASMLLGSLLLRGRFHEPSWRSRAGSLVLLGLVGLCLWAVHHGEVLGLGHEPDHAWLRDALRLGARWAWMAILAGLAADLALHLGREEAAESRASLYALIAGGAVVWALLLLHMTDWLRGWPLRPRGHLVPLTWLLALGHAALRSLACFSLTVLCLLAARACTAMIGDLDRAERGAHLFASPSDAAWTAPREEPYARNGSPDR